VHILSKDIGQVHISHELVKQKIPILSDRASENNRQVLMTIALKGPLLKYDVRSEIGSEYSTISRRIDDLLKKGYLVEAGTRITQRGVPETQYGLTWIGLVASLAIDEVMKNALEVMQKNLTSLNTKDLQDIGFNFVKIYALVREFFESILTTQQIEAFTKALFKGYLNSPVPSLDHLAGAEGSLSIENLSWVMIVLQSSWSEISNLPDGQPIPVMDIIGLLDNPDILSLTQSLLLQASERFKEGLENQYRLLVHIPGEIGTILQGLSPEDKPSQKVKEFLENELSRPSFSLEVKE